MTPNPTTVLVTGGSGFVGAHLILQLLAAGYVVRTTIRNLSREEEIRKWLKDAGVRDSDRLSFYAADLLNDDGWSESMKGCTFVHHVASPFPSGAPKNEDELIVPAREGTLRVLSAALKEGVKRVILTSSFAAVGYGHNSRTRKEAFTENDWTNLGGSGVTAYHKSKTLAEKAAWEFVKEKGAGLELTVINPVGIFGPVLSNDFSSSIQIVKRLMDGSMPGCPQLHFGTVDVRDLADLHLRAMMSSVAAGERFLAVSDGGSISIFDIAKIIRKNRPEKAAKVPTKQLPNLLIHISAIFSPTARAIVPQLGDVKVIENKKAKDLLGWKPRTVEETMVDTADSLVKFGIV
ncbi:hypothetical protein F5884DRAFT_809776 [Xylogone sp. PMI_703]|nr:hypothetical protein F5884DRAFT_809776 [Xylogone sp. PMI_703]